MTRRTFPICLLLALLPLQVSWSQQSSELSSDESAENTNDDKLQAVQDFLQVLEEAYSCNLIVNSTTKLIDSLTISIVGRGDSCDDAIDTLLQEFQPPEIVIVATTADPNPEVGEVDDYDCLEGFGCKRDFQNQDTIIDPNATTEPR